MLVDGKPAGIITDRDTAQAIAQGADGSARKVADYLSRKLMTAPPTMDVREAARVMRTRASATCVVVNDAGGAARHLLHARPGGGLLKELQAASVPTA